MKYLPGLVKGPTGGKLASGLDDVIICTMSELEVSWTLKFKDKKSYISCIKVANS